jgi:hypothetical protein
MSQVLNVTRKDREMWPSGAERERQQALKDLNMEFDGRTKYGFYCSSLKAAVIVAGADDCRNGDILFAGNNSWILERGPVLLNLLDEDELRPTGVSGSLDSVD